MSDRTSPRATVAVCRSLPSPVVSLRSSLFGVTLAGALFVFGCGPQPGPDRAASTPVLETYAALVHRTYGDTRQAWRTARSMTRTAPKGGSTPGRWMRSTSMGATMPPWRV